MDILKRFKKIAHYFRILKQINLGPTRNIDLHQFMEDIESSEPDREIRSTILRAFNAAKFIMTMEEQEQDEMFEFYNQYLEEWATILTDKKDTNRGSTRLKIIQVETYNSNQVNTIEMYVQEMTTHLHKLLFQQCHM